ncbi:MAG: cytochrome c biogenesis protein DipZ [Actinobacteria bacterium]|nr:cytochrome c biogenesis protein DipZ [Micrococcales bacterium]MCB0903731.1 cytochrome c biogenesis protein DipZ [Actinomycetota bacterium]MCO5299542.1 cytochrome c biogenesis protein DipZ [Candidatus Nanopelagicales bacterium]HPE13266.1 cytochrome c biogenesis protein DipZ [Actinomycetota bacterium]HRV66284.1 cytochrome c biogenesis protein DipZ [Candidatus Nanopelagicales bacterium]
MLTLVLIGLLSGVVTGLSPCVLPVLPVVLGASATGPEGPSSRTRPFVIIAGLVTSFALATLAGSALLNLLGLPQDLLRWLGIAVLVVVGLGLLFPPIGRVLERPFARIPQRALNREGSAFVLGMSFGLVFVPCAGPVLAAITVLSATGGFGAGLIVLTASFAIGVALPLLGFAIAGQRMAERIRSVRGRTQTLRKVVGAVMVVTAVALSLNLTDSIQRYVPGYVALVQDRIEGTDSARAALDDLSGRQATTAGAGDQLTFDQCAEDPAQLHNCGPARDLVGIQEWLNSKPLELVDLRGRVVLVDFWTYSCINCQRTLPYITDWDAKYRQKGLTVIGVHSPEFAFEREVPNVADNAERLGVKYPIAIDNGFQTWRAWDQRYWPAHYLIDQTGQVRQVHYGEGAYAQTEKLIQDLLDAGEQAVSADPTQVRTQGQTPETYLGYERARSVVNASNQFFDEQHAYSAVDVARDQVALDGQWTVEPERIVAGEDASLRLRYYARDMYLVLGGEGTVEVRENGRARTIEVKGAPTLYALASHTPQERVAELRMSPGVSAYAFTFG